MNNFWQGFFNGLSSSMFNSMFGGFMPCCNNFGVGMSVSVFSGPPMVNFNNFCVPPNTFVSTPMQISTPMYNMSNYSVFNNVSQTFNFNNFGFVNYGFNAGFMPFVNSVPIKSSKNASSVKHWSKMTDSEMKEIYGNYDLDITVKSDITAEQINQFLKKKYPKSKLAGKGQVFIDAQNKYGISALVLLGICGKETSYGTTGHAVDGLNNIVNIQKSNPTTNDRWRKFDSVEDCIMELARLLKENYVNSPGDGKVQHLTKLYQVNAKYCPAAETSRNSGWAKGVNSCINNIKRTISNM